MKAFVITPEQKARNLSLVDKLAQVPGLEVEVFPARMLKTFPDDFDYRLAKSLSITAPIAAEVGCAMSHRDLLAREAGEPHSWFLVFEDDAVLPSPSELVLFISRLKQSKLSELPAVVSLYSEGVVLSEWPTSEFVRCLVEPPFTVAYAITPKAAGMIATTNARLQYRADWPRNSGVAFFLYWHQIIEHGDGAAGSLIGDRSASGLADAFTWRNVNAAKLRNRVSLYSTNYLFSRRYFDGPKDYFNKVLRHRVVWHMARTIFRRNLVRRGVYVVPCEERRNRD